MVNENMEHQSINQISEDAEFRISKTSKRDEGEEKKKARSLSPEEFVRNLLDEASRVPCDETMSDFNKNDLPDFYDPVKFKRAQQFFKDNIFALYASKLLGLIITLVSPSVLKILQMTKMSGCIMTSYRRYVATLSHMNIWYENDLTENSRAMQSIKLVKSMHNSASKQARNKGIESITQKDMVLTQFGFMGLAISRGEMIGIHNASKEDLEYFIHFWRVLGYIMGIQDRFNLCRESLEETREICEILINKVLLPSFETKNEEFLEMTSYIVDGLWHINPVLNFKVFITYLHEMLKSKRMNNDIKEETNIDHFTYFNLNWREILHINFISFVFSIMKFTIVRVFLNSQQYFSLWIVKHYPFLAVYRFGHRNGLVPIKLSNPKHHVS